MDEPLVADVRNDSRKPKAKGFQPGNRYGRQFPKGVSGNPGGIPKGLHELRVAARSYTKLALERLAYWAASDDPRASVTASAHLLDRAWGKPVQPLEHQGDAPVKLVVVWQDEQAQPVVQQPVLDAELVQAQPLQAQASQPVP